MVIGITGNFGAGKTTVANIFRRLGAEVVDADRIAHRIIQPNISTYKKIIAAFGNRVLAGAYISRKKLATEVFSDQRKLKRLNKIMHPEILRIIKRRIKKISANKILVIDAALLIESGLLPWIDRLVVVKSKPKIQIQRLNKAGLTANQIESRLSFQLPQDEKASFADFLIDNSGRRTQTEKQVRNIWNKISKNMN